MPGGLAYYQACLDYHLGTRLTPAEIHSVGHREVNRLEGLMNEVGLITKNFNNFTDWNIENNISFAF